jgi:hypothetical protein
LSRLYGARGEQLGAQCAAGAVREYDDPNRRLDQSQLPQDGGLGGARLVEYHYPRGAVRDQLLERGSAEVGTEDPKTRILLEDLSQAAAREHVEAADGDRDRPSGEGWLAASRAARRLRGGTGPVIMDVGIANARTDRDPRTCTRQAARMNANAD